MLTLIKALLSIVNLGLQYMHNRDLLKAGEHSAIAKAQKELNNAISNSVDIRRRARANINELRNDKNSYRD